MRTSFTNIDNSFTNRSLNTISVSFRKFLNLYLIRIRFNRCAIINLSKVIGFYSNFRLLFILSSISHICSNSICNFRFPTGKVPAGFSSNNRCCRGFRSRNDSRMNHIAINILPLQSTVFTLVVSYIKGVFYHLKFYYIFSGVCVNRDSLTTTLALSQDIVFWQCDRLSYCNGRLAINNIAFQSRIATNLLASFGINEFNRYGSIIFRRPLSIERIILVHCNGLTRLIPCSSTISLGIPATKIIAGFFQILFVRNSQRGALLSLLAVGAATLGCPILIIVKIIRALISDCAVDMPSTIVALIFNDIPLNVLSLRIPIPTSCISLFNQVIKSLLQSRAHCIDTRNSMCRIKVHKQICVIFAINEIGVISLLQ